MAISLTHSKVSGKADSADSTLVQPSDWNAEHGLTAGANVVLGTTTAGAVTEISCTAAGRALIDDASAADQRTTLGLVIGTNVQAQDAELSAIAGLTSAADSAPYFTGSGTAALMTVTSAARTVLDDTSVANMRTTLGAAASGAAASSGITATGPNKVVGRMTSGSGAVEELQYREVLTANRTYYVRTDGSDSNTGLTNSSGGAFLTIQKALDVTETIDLNGYTVTVQIGDGTYTAPITVPKLTGQGEVNNLIIQGNTTTPANVLISVSSGNAAVQVGPGAMVELKGMKLASSTAAGIRCFSGGQAWLSSVHYGACSTEQIMVEGGAYVWVENAYTIAGGAANHMRVYTNATMAVAGITVTVTGTPAFSWAFAVVEAGAAVECGGLTFSGSATGTRYSVTSNGSCNTAGGGASYFPGDVAGSTATGGQYI